MSAKHFINSLRVFPLCDTRGWVTDLLCNPSGSSRYEGHRPDALFFSWLLELPATIEPSAAARSLLAVAGLEHSPPASAQSVQGELHRLLADVVEKPASGY